MKDSKSPVRRVGATLRTWGVECDSSASSSKYVYLVAEGGPLGESVRWFEDGENLLVARQSGKTVRGKVTYRVDVAIPLSQIQQLEVLEPTLNGVVAKWLVLPIISLGWLAFISRIRAYMDRSPWWTSLFIVLALLYFLNWFLPRFFLWNTAVLCVRTRDSRGRYYEIKEVGHVRKAVDHLKEAVAKAHNLTGTWEEVPTMREETIFTVRKTFLYRVHPQRDSA